MIESLKIEDPPPHFSVSSRGGRETARLERGLGAKRLRIGIIESTAVLKVTKRSINHGRFNRRYRRRGRTLAIINIFRGVIFFFFATRRVTTKTLTLADSAAPHVAQLSADYLYCVPRYHVQREKSISRWPFDQRLSIGCISRRG